MKFTNICIILAAAVLSFLPAIATAAPADRIECFNVPYKSPLHLVAAYFDGNGNFQSPPVTAIYSNNYNHRFLVTSYKGANNTKFQFLNDRLVMHHRVRNGSHVPYNSQNLVEGQVLLFAPPYSGRGNLGLVDTDVKDQGDAGCGVLVGRRPLRGAFQLCNGVVYFQAPVKWGCVNTTLTFVNTIP